MTLAKVGSALLIQLPSMCCLNQNVRGKASILCGLTVLVFDEMKVACHLMWHSRSQTLSGLTLTAEDLSSLIDVYELLQKPKVAAQTCYILWHDLTNNHNIIGPYFICQLCWLQVYFSLCARFWPVIINIIGPYFTSANSVDFKFVLACVLDTVKLFQHHGLKTSFLVCDGCSTNLITIKVAHGRCGAYSMLDDTTNNKLYC